MREAVEKITDGWCTFRREGTRLCAFGTLSEKLKEEIWQRDPYPNRPRTTR